MATSGKNLSSFDKKTLPDAKKMVVGIVVSEWNNEITENLLKGAKDSKFGLPTTNPEEIETSEIEFIEDNFM